MQTVLVLTIHWKKLLGFRIPRTDHYYITLSSEGFAIFICLQMGAMHFFYILHPLFCRKVQQLSRAENVFVSAVWEWARNGFLRWLYLNRIIARFLCDRMQFLNISSGWRAQLLNISWFQNSCRGAIRLLSSTCARLCRNEYGTL